MIVNIGVFMVFMAMVLKVKETFHPNLTLNPKLKKLLQINNLDKVKI